MYVPVLTSTLEASLRNESEYDKLQRKSDRVSWNYHIHKTKHERNYALINKFSHIKKNNDSIIQFEIARRDNSKLHWLSNHKKPNLLFHTH
jgi:hypothetical protein